MPIHLEMIMTMYALKIPSPQCEYLSFFALNWSMANTKASFVHRYCFIKERNNSIFGLSNKVHLRSIFAKIIFILVVRSN